MAASDFLGDSMAKNSTFSAHPAWLCRAPHHRSHFGSRYTSGCCDLAGLFSLFVVKYLWINIFHINIRWRPYRVECTGSLSTSEVKRHRAWLVLGWGTAWEHPEVLPAFFLLSGYSSIGLLRPSCRAEPAQLHSFVTLLSAEPQFQRRLWEWATS